MRALARAISDYEHQHQVAVIEWRDRIQKRHEAVGYLFAVPNAGKRSPAVAGRMKAEGLTAGVPDLCLPVARGGFAGLWIEMKSPTNGLTDKQKEWKEKLEAEDHKVLVCRSSQEAIAEIREYLGL